MDRAAVAVVGACLLVACEVPRTDPTPAARGVSQVSIRIEPAETTVAPGMGVQFRAQVTGADPGVVWCLEEPLGGELLSGSYVAPGREGSYHVSVTSLADPRASARATIHVSRVTVRIDPPSARVETSGTVDFRAEVSGAPDTSISWSIAESDGGSISAGHYVAPASPGVFRVEARSNADPRVVATATVETVTALRVAASVGVLTSGESVEVSAADSEGSPVEVSWSVVEPDGGTVSGASANAAVYTAPARNGTFHIVATTVHAPASMATVPVVVLPRAPASPANPPDGCPSRQRPAGLCEGAWCWDYPAPFGHDLKAVALQGPDDLWVAGNSIVGRRTAGDWTLFQPPQGAVKKLWVRTQSPVEVFALTDSKVMRFDGIAWTTSLAGDWINPVTSMAVGGGQAFATRGQDILRYDGSGWQVVFSMAANTPRGLWASPSGEVWAGAGLQIVHWDGQQWTVRDHGLVERKYNSANTTYAVPVTVHRIFGSPDGSSIQAGGDCASLAQLENGGWKLIQGTTCGWHMQQYSERDDLLLRGPAEVISATTSYFVQGGMQFEYYRLGFSDKAGSSSVEPPRRVRAVASDGEKRIAVGDGGAIWNAQDGEWRMESGNRGFGVSSLWVGDCGGGLALVPKRHATFSDYFWTTGFLRREAAGWMDDGEAPTSLKRLWALDENRAWAVGPQGAWRRSAEGWSAIPELQGLVLTGVSGTAADDVWVVGPAGAAFHWDGTHWEPRPMPASVSQGGGDISARSRTDVYGRTGGGRDATTRYPEALWHWDGIAWKGIELPGGAEPAAIAADESALWVLPRTERLRVVLRLEAGVWSAVPVHDTASSWGVPGINVLRTGEVVIADGTGVYLRRSDEFERIGGIWALAANVAVDGSGRLLYASQSGILVEQR
jgi:hypothetical protein